jgi:hypothetical protein
LNTEQSPIYKVLRSLWFPVSVNAIVLGATAVVLFRAVSLLGAWTCGYAGPAWEADSAFDDALWFVALRGPSAIEDVEIRFGLPLSLFALQCVAAYALWATFGLAMCRTLVLRIAKDEYVPLKDAWRFALGAKNTLLLAAPAVAVPLGFCALVLSLGGALGAAPWIGWVLSAVALPIFALFTVVLRLVWIATFVAAAFPPAAVAAERRGTYDALGRAFHYVFARPLTTLLYLVLLAAFLFALDAAALSPDSLRETAADLLTSAPRLFGGGETYGAILRGDVTTTTGFARFCAWAHLVVFGGVDAIVRGAYLSFVAGGACALFLVSRQDCDGVDVGDVVRDA